jgi:hypothetical protein
MLVGAFSDADWAGFPNIVGVQEALLYSLVVT